MKMFSWMHHKFRTNTGYELLARRKAIDDDDEAVAPTSFRTLQEGEATKLLVLEKGELVLEEWHGGFLTIGTASSSDEERAELEAAGVDGDEAKKRWFGAPFPNSSVYQQWESMDWLVSQAHAELSWAGDDMDTIALLHHVVQFLTEEEGEKETGVERMRTTLAELFSRRESIYFPGLIKDGRADGGANARKENSCPTRSSSDVIIEPIGPKGEETEPSIKLHKAQPTASKMLKRKIHPEVERGNDMVDDTVARVSEEGDDGVRFPHDHDKDVKVKASTAGFNTQRSRTVGWEKLTSEHLK